MMWQKVKLGDVLDFFNGKSIADRNSGNYKIYGANGVIGRSEDFKYENAIILGRVGAYCGSVMYENNKFWATDNTIVVKPRINGIERFYYYLLTHLSLNNYAGGAAQPLITQSIIKAIETQIPVKLEVLINISTVLSAYDDLIENNTRRIKILEEMAQTIYKEWFVNFRFPGYEKVKFVDSPLGKIPEGWEVKRLGDLTKKITKGTTPTTLGKAFMEKGINFIKIESIQEDGALLENKFAKIDIDTDNLLKRSQLEENDILFSIAGVIGRTTIIPRRILPANTNQALAIIRPFEANHANYLYQTVKSEKFQNHGMGYVVQTAQANVSLSVLSNIPIIFPQPNYLDIWEQVIEPIRSLIEELRNKNKNISFTRDLLLPKLMSGEVEV